MKEVNNKVFNNREFTCRRELDEYCAKLHRAAYLLHEDSLITDHELKLIEDKIHRQRLRSEVFATPNNNTYMIRYNENTYEWDYKVSAIEHKFNVAKTDAKIQYNVDIKCMKDGEFIPTHELPLEVYGMIKNHLTVKHV